MLHMVMDEAKKRNKKVGCFFIDWEAQMQLTIDFANQQLADMRVGGVFQVGKVDDMLDAIETNFGLQIERLGEKTVRIDGVANQ